MSNVARAARLLTALAERGVETIVLCPGGRNAPLAACLDGATPFTTLSFYEERSAAFFALGRARATDRAVAVITTSGTAAAELLPAAIEARYSGVPLVLVTADRPPALRGTGAPQAIVQPGLFGDYAPTVFDGTTEDAPDLSAWDERGPIHLNICFDEPLLDEDIPPLATPPRAPRPGRRTPDAGALRGFLGAARHPLVVVGPLHRDEHAGVRAFLTRLGAPVVAEAVSGLREDPVLAGLVLHDADRSARLAEFDGILRIGGVPTLRYWRHLDRKTVPVCSISPVPLAGLARGDLIVAHPGTLLDETETPRRPSDDVLAHDRVGARRLADALDGEPASEPAMVRALSRIIPDGSLVYLGNSLPIREWDLAAERMGRWWRVAASRGANGIDGQVSTFLGMCGGDEEHWCVVGDLTALYDLPAPWVLPRLDCGPIRIVVINNGGGQIFGRLFDRPSFINAHDRSFKHWARMWGVHYAQWNEVPDGPLSPVHFPSPAIIELRPDPAATRRFWDVWDGKT